MSSAPPTSPAPPDECDVVVVGGGAAGLAAALNLARVRRSVVVVDAGEPRNAPAAHSHGYLTRDGVPPLDLLRMGRAEVEGYGGVVVDGRVVAARSTPGEDGSPGFTLTLDDGRVLRSRRVLLTTGLVDELADIPGLAERWGRDVVHCPFCHGWEVRDRPLAVVDTGNGAHQAQMFSTLSDDVTLVVHEGDGPTADQRERLAALGIPVLDGPVVEVVARDGELRGLRLADGRVLGCRAVATVGRMVARSSLASELGLDVVEHPSGLGVHVPVAPDGATAVAGVWAAGNVSDPGANVALSAAQGAMAGGRIHGDLLDDDARRAAAAAAPGFRGHLLQPDDRPDGPTHDHHHGDGRDHGADAGAKDPFGPDVVMDQAFWDERYRAADQIWSGRPNPQLVAEALDLTPGRALDLGAGEGADAIWLAEQGWDVTAVDISGVALERGRLEAGHRGAAVAARIHWQLADLADPDDWGPPAGSFELVSLQFLHLSSAERAVAYPRAAAAVAPGGTLLVVAHHPRDVGDHGRPDLPDRFFTAEELADELGDGWDVVAAEARARRGRRPDGGTGILTDAVLVARRR